MSSGFPLRRDPASIQGVRIRLLVLMVAVSLLAACAELVTLEPHPGQSWTDEAGRRVGPETVALYASDCLAWQGAGFLDLRYPPGDGAEGEMRRYARDPEGSLPPVELIAPYDANSSLSRDALYTGYSTERFMLFFGADHEIYAYLVDGPRVEALPRVEDSLVCP